MLVSLLPMSAAAEDEAGAGLAELDVSMPPPVAHKAGDMEVKVTIGFKNISATGLASFDFTLSSSLVLKSVEYANDFPVSSGYSTQQTTDHSVRSTYVHPENFKEDFDYLTATFIVPARAEVKDYNITVTVISAHAYGDETSENPEIEVSIPARTGTLTVTHSMEVHPRKEPTCEGPGTEAYWYCDVCKKYYTDEEGTTVTANPGAKIEALGHDWGEPTWDWVEDYTAATATFVCSRADHPETVTDETIDVDETEPSCTVDGKTVYTATVVGPDGETYTDTRTVNGDEAAGHNYDTRYEWDDELQNYYFYYTCENDCGTEDSVPVGYTTEDDPAPTCEEAGVCKYVPNPYTLDGEEYAVPEDFPYQTVPMLKLEHAWTVEFDWDSWIVGNETVKVTFTCPNGPDGDHKYTAEPVLADVTQATNGGTTVYTATIPTDRAPDSFDAEQLTSTKTVMLYVLGDVDNNGEINANDASYVLMWIVDKPVSVFNEQAADVDGNNIINANDASYILQYIVSKISVFPAEAKS